MKKRSTALLLACVLILGVAIGGTVAWIVDTTDEVRNVFTIGDINIELWEHQANADGTFKGAVVREGETNTYYFMPGDTLKKDPTVTVLDGSEACYIFVKVIETNNTFGADPVKDVLTYTVDTSVWTPYTVEGVYYKVQPAIAKGAEDVNLNVLTDKQVTVNTAITKDLVQTMQTTAIPALSFKAAAIQSDNIQGNDEAERVANAYDALPDTFRN